MLIETSLNHVQVASSLLSYGTDHSNSLISPNYLPSCYGVSDSKQTHMITLHAGYSFNNYDLHDDEQSADGDYDNDFEESNYDDDFEESNYDKYNEDYEDGNYEGRFEDGFDDYYIDDEDNDYL